MKAEEPERLVERLEQVFEIITAGKAGERLNSAAEERGLTSEGLKDVAGEVADTFKGAMSGQSEEPGGATPGSSGGTSGSGQNLGMDQRQQGGGGTQSSNPAGTGGRSIR
jgi:hypothetical protein